MCRVDLPNIRKRYNKRFPIWGAIYVQTEKRDMEERESGKKRGKRTKNDSFGSQRAERKEVNFKCGVGHFRETDGVFPNWVRHQNP